MLLVGNGLAHRRRACEVIWTKKSKFSRYDHCKLLSDSCLFVASPFTFESVPTGQ